MLQYHDQANIFHFGGIKLCGILHSFGTSSLKTDKAQLYTLFKYTPSPSTWSFKGPLHLVLKRGSMQRHSMLVSQKQQI